MKMRSLKRLAVVQTVTLGMCLTLVLRSVAQEVSSLKNLDFERDDPSVRAESIQDENTRLKVKLEAVEASMRAQQNSLLTSGEEAEIFRRKASELNVRLEALGAGTADDRLIKLLGNLAVVEAERRQLKAGLLKLWEAVLIFQKVSVTTDADTRLELEVAMRAASKALEVQTASSVVVESAPSSLTEGMVISIKDELSLVVANVGSEQGVKPGMPFKVWRGNEVIGAVRAVDVRDRITGALVQNLGSKGNVKVGDRLKVEAQN